MNLRVVSHGGGVQTTAMLVLAAQGRIDYKTFLFANVGDDSEHPGTLRYLREIAVPYAEQHGITIHELRRIKRDGSVETIYGRLTREGGRSLTIPVRMSTGAPARRSCTSDFKIRVIGKWLKEHGATPDEPATVAVGISVDEIERATSKHVEPYERVVYPLLDLRLRRNDCEQIIRAGGLPLPGKSACWFCPFHRRSAWQDMARQDLELFGRACDLETMLRERQVRNGKGPIYFTDYGKPLAEIVMRGQDTLPGMDEHPHCDNGWCMT